MSFKKLIKKRLKREPYRGLNFKKKKDLTILEILKQKTVISAKHVA
jgi:hypothetical protein